MDEAVRLANELLIAYAPILRSLELRSSSGGRFEVTLDDELVFSKAALHRFPRPAEIVELFSAKLGPPLAWR